MDKLTNDRLDPMIADALRTSPLEPVPAGFRRGVLARVAALEQAYFPFAVSWLDLALSLFGAGMFALALLAVWSIPAEALPRLQWYSQWAGYLFQRALPWLLVGCAAAGIAVALCWLWFSSRRRGWIMG